MQKQLPNWQLIQTSLQQKVSVMLLYVLESRGSSPGRQGFMMVVNANGEMSGSLGGGIMEYKFVEMAKEKLKQDTQEIDIRKQVHSKSAKRDQSGMICSGEQTILLYAVQEEDTKYIKAIINSLSANKNGTIELSAEGISFSENIPTQNFYFKQKGEDDFLYIEKTGYKNQLHIIGAGHCSLALSKIMSDMNFYIHLYDDRRALNTFEQNGFAHAKTVVDDYVKLSEIIPTGDNIYIVVMTVGYRTDKLVVESLKGRQFKYFGLLGSSTKIETIFQDFINNGFTEEELKNINAPIGLPIKSQTTEEIAISIAAEIIKVKNGADL